MAKSQTSGPSDLTSLLPALSKLIEKAGSGPIQLSVSLCDDKVVSDLREKIASLEVSLEREIAIRNRAERLYGEQVFLNGELLDLCREHNVPLPRKFSLRK